jgi:hypothetical protein
LPPEWWQTERTAFCRGANRLPQGFKTSASSGSSTLKSSRPCAQVAVFLSSPLRRACLSRYSPLRFGESPVLTQIRKGICGKYFAATALNSKFQIGRRAQVQTRILKISGAHIIQNFIILFFQSVISTCFFLY